MASRRRPLTAKNLGLSGMNPHTPTRHNSDGIEDATTNQRQPPPAPAPSCSAAGLRLKGKL
jgi:hypothetical protein